MKLGICERDGTFELNIIPKGREGVKPNWWVVDAQTGTIIKEVVTESVTPDKKEGGGLCPKKSSG